MFPWMADIIRLAAAIGHIAEAGCFQLRFQLLQPIQQAGNGFTNRIGNQKSYKPNSEVSSKPRTPPQTTPTACSL